MDTSWTPSLESQLSICNHWCSLGKRTTIVGSIRWRCQTGLNTPTGTKGIFLRCKTRLAPALSLGSTSSFCSPFCKISCYHVLELRDRARRKLAGSGEVLVQNVLRPPQRVAGDRNDLRERAALCSPQRRALAATSLQCAQIKNQSSPVRPLFHVSQSTINP